MMSETHPGAHRAPSPSPMTRTQVARRLGVSIATVRRLERAGKLKTEANAFGTRLFDPVEVERLAAARTATATSGALAARVFQAIRDGFELRDIVIALQVPPRVVRELFAEWQAMGPSSRERGTPTHRVLSPPPHASEAPGRLPGVAARRAAPDK
jgi:hypothetical protein